MGSCQSLGQHRARWRRQGLQAQDCHDCDPRQKRNRLCLPQRRYQKFFDDQVKDRSGHKVVNRNQGFRFRRRIEVFDLLRQQGTQDIWNRSEVCQRHFHSQFQVQLGRLQPFFLIPFYHLQQAFHKLLFRQQVLRKHLLRKLQVIQQPFL